MDEPKKTDEVIDKFIKERGMPDWIEHISKGKVSDQMPKHPDNSGKSIVDFVKNVFS